MTDAELKGVAMQALNLAKLEFEREGGVGFMMFAYFAGEGLRRMEEMEDVLVERLGECWLDDGNRKTVAFAAIRKMVSLMPPDAILFVTCMNGFVPTPALLARGEAEQEALKRASHKRHHQAVKEGLLTIHDILNVVAQTPELVCMAQQELDERHEFTGAPHAGVGPQDGFVGRLKMFGDLRPENLG